MKVVATLVVIGLTLDFTTGLNVVHSKRPINTHLGIEGHQRIVEHVNDLLLALEQSLKSSLHARLQYPVVVVVGQIIDVANFIPASRRG